MRSPISIALFAAFGLAACGGSDHSNATELDELREQVTQLEAENEELRAAGAANTDETEDTAAELDELREQVTQLEIENEELRAAGAANTDETEDTAADGGTSGPTTTEPTASDDIDVTCTYAGTGQEWHMPVELIFTNTLGDIGGLDITYALFDGDGGPRIDTGYWSVGFPRADEQFRVFVDGFTEMPPDVDGASIVCEVLSVERAIWSDSELQPATDVDTCSVQGDDVLLA